MLEELEYWFGSRDQVHPLGRHRRCLCLCLNVMFFEWCATCAAEYFACMQNKIYIYIEIIDENFCFVFILLWIKESIFIYIYLLHLYTNYCSSKAGFEQIWGML